MNKCLLLIIIFQIKLFPIKNDCKFFIYFLIEKKCRKIFIYFLTQKTISLILIYFDYFNTLITIVSIKYLDILKIK